MKTEVDLQELATAVSQAILQFAQPVVVEQPVKKKRGRPKKKQQQTITPQQPSNPNNLFVDDGILKREDSYINGKKIIYPQHAPPRPKQEKQQYICGKCSKPFMAYPSYIARREESLCYCYDCNCK